MEVISKIKNGFSKVNSLFKQLKLFLNEAYLFAQVLQDRERDILFPLIDGLDSSLN